MRRLALGALLLVACGEGGQVEADGQDAGPGGPGEDGGGGKGDDPDGDGGAGPLEYLNPVLEGCADPGVLAHDGRWYMSCTGGTGGNSFPIYVSDDLVSWTREGWVFPAGTQPAWAEGHFWAPELHEVPGGVAVYYSALSGGKHVVGVASATDVLGPYTDPGAPIVVRDVSVIDAHAFVDDDGTRWLYWKGERQPDALYARKLTPDGLALSPEHGERVLSATLDWEHDVVEAPWVVRRGDTYFLFYSGGAYCNATYAVGVARGPTPLGPFEKLPAPLVASAARFVGPGHNAVTTGPGGELFMVYHAYRTAEGTPACGSGTPGDNNARHVLIDPLDMGGGADGWPAVYSDDVSAALDPAGALTVAQVNPYKGGQFDDLDPGGPVTFGTARRFAAMLATSYKRTALIGMQEAVSADVAEEVRAILDEETGHPWAVRFFDADPDGPPAYERLAIFWRTDVLEVVDDLGVHEVERLDSGAGPRTRSLYFAGLVMRLLGTQRDVALFTGKLVPLGREIDGVEVDNDDRAAEAARLRAWIADALATHRGTSRVIAIDTNADRGTAPWTELRAELWDGDDDTPTHFAYGARRIDHIFWDMDGGPRRTDGILVGPYVSADFGSDHRAVVARVHVHR
ncbi:MAG TPA: glycoside hydrolase family 43 protein [Kofleriaceae bacterium]|nr:glycoside hydrolase family 43 protein [Kofleriaceae bacterium]